MVVHSDIMDTENLTPMTNESTQNTEEIIAAYQSRLRSFIRKRVARKEDAEDILQDVFYQMVNAIDNTLSPIENLTGWLYRVTRNTIINKKKKRKESLPGFDEEDLFNDFTEVLFADNNATPETEYLKSLFWEELTDALNEIPKEQKEAFELTEFKGLSVKEIAQKNNVSINTILSRKHYAVIHLRNRLETLYQELV